MKRSPSASSVTKRNKKKAIKKKGKTWEDDVRSGRCPGFSERPCEGLNVSEDTKIYKNTHFRRQNCNQPKLLAVFWNDGFSCCYLCLVKCGAYWNWVVLSVVGSGFNFLHVRCKMACLIKYRVVWNCVIDFVDLSKMWFLFCECFFFIFYYFLKCLLQFFFAAFY